VGGLWRIALTVAIVLLPVGLVPILSEIATEQTIDAVVEPSGCWSEADAPGNWRTSAVDPIRTFD
jgi:hypothetical protein